MNIYTETLKEIAVRSEILGRISQPYITVTRSNPICGDRVVLDLKLEGGELKFGMEVKGCLICQSSAVLLSKYCNHKLLKDFNCFEHSVNELINNGNRDNLLEDYSFSDEVKVFSPLANYKTRHSCVLLPIQALHDALESMSFKGAI